MNSYFQVITNENGVDIKFFRATNGDKKLGIQEVTNYLAREKIKFDLKALNQAMNSNEEETILHLSDEPILPISEKCSIQVSQNRMQATIRFYPPTENGNLYNKESIYSELRIEKIVSGIDDSVIESFLSNRCYCTDYVIAKGTPCREGKDAEIKYYFETDNKIRPTLREDGTVDFFNLNVFAHCIIGDVLAELIPEDPGESGLDIFGNVIKPHDVKKKKLSYGMNIDLSEDGHKLISKVNGHVSLIDGKVFVNDVLTVKNVDNSTGNINYAGNVIVEGNVCANFSIISHGSVEVKGIVEGAVIHADGNIVLNRGINGMGKGELRSKGNIIAKFLENCNVDAEGYVETESILHSNVQAGTEVNVVSRKGFISGGSVSATNIIRVKSLGSEMGADTSVSVGVDPSMTNHYNELGKEILAAQKNLKKMMPVLEASMQKVKSGVKLLPDQMKSLQQLVASTKQLQNTIVENTKEMESLKEMMDSGTDARIEVSGIIYAGTTITISGVSMLIKDNMRYCAFHKNEGIISATSL